MSLLSPEYYCASMAPGRVSLLRLRGKLRPAIVDKRQAQCEPLKNGKWQAELQLLAKLLEDGASSRSLPLTIVLSNQLVRYCVVPATTAMLPDIQSQQLLHHCFAEIYGDLAEQWQFRVSAFPEGDALVACAIDTSLLEAMREMCRATKSKLFSVKPHLMAGFNRASHLVQKQPCCYVQIEDGRLLVGLMQDGIWVSVSVLAITAEWENELSTYIRREILLAGWEKIRPEVLLDMAQPMHALHWPSEEYQHVIHVPQPSVAGYSAKDNHLFAMALSGL